MSGGPISPLSPVTSLGSSSTPAPFFHHAPQEVPVAGKGGLRMREKEELPTNAYVAKANEHFQSRIGVIFAKFDADGSGNIDKPELREVLTSMGYDVTEQQLDALLAQVDVDGSGTLDLDEFTTLVQLWMEAAGYKIFTDEASTSVQHMSDAINRITKCILPDAPWRWAMDTAFLCVTSYFFLSVLAMHTLRNDELYRNAEIGLIAPDIICTLFLLVEIVLKFNTAAIKKDQPLVVDQKEIAKEYLMGWFWLDFISMLPMRFFSTDKTTSMVLNHFRLLLVFRILTLFPQSGVFPITAKFVRVQYNILPYFKIILYFVCVVLMLTVIHQEFQVLAVYKGLTPPGEATFASSLFWTMYVISGVGYGDMYPREHGHRWYAGGLFIFSMIVNGAFVGSMVTVMQEADVENNRRSQLVLMQAVLRYFHVPTALQEEILQFQNHILQRDLSASYSHIVDPLPGEIKHNILMQSNVPLIQGVHTFRTTHVSTLVQIAECLVPLFASPEVYVAVAGDISSDLVLLNYGFIDVLSCVGEFVTTLKRGDYFGEKGMLLKDETVLYKYSYKALTYCDLFLFSVDQLAFLELRFPKFAKDMGEMAVSARGSDRFDVYGDFPEPDTLSPMGSPAKLNTSLLRSASGSGAAAAGEGKKPQRRRSSARLGGASLVSQTHAGIGSRPQSSQSTDMVVVDAEELMGLPTPPLPPLASVPRPHSVAKRVSLDADLTESHHQEESGEHELAEMFSWLEKELMAESHTIARLEEMLRSTTTTRQGPEETHQHARNGYVSDEATQQQTVATTSVLPMNETAVDDITEVEEM